MNLLQDTHQPRSLSNQLKAQAAELAALELQGYAEGEQPVDPAELAAEAADLLSGTFTAANQLLTSLAAGVPKVIAVPDDGAAFRKGAAPVNGHKASADSVLARLSSGDLGFKDVFTWAIDQGVVLANVWRFEVFTGTDTTSNSRLVGVFDNLSGAVTITLADPPFSCKGYILYDPLGEIDGTNNLTIDADNGNVNGTTSVNYTTTNGMWMCVGNRESGGSMRWLIKEL